MRDTMTPEERLQRVARLLVKAMYLSLDGEKAEGDGDGCGYENGAGSVRGYAAVGNPMPGKDGEPGVVGGSEYRARRVESI